MQARLAQSAERKASGGVTKRFEGFVRWLAALAMAFGLGAVWELRQLRAQGLGPAEPARGPPFEVLSWQPRMFLARGLVSEEEARHIIQLAEREIRMKPSETGSGSGGAGRTSTTAWMYGFEEKDAVVSKVVDRMHALAQQPRTHGETLSVARYDAGEHYGWHFDTDSAELRLATVLVYLQSPTSGGETAFPFAQGQTVLPAWPPPFSPADGPVADTPFEEYCSGSHGGLRVAPKAGDAVLFFSHDHKMEFELAAWHAACPVTGGQKWIMQRWIKALPMSEWVERTHNMTYRDWKLLMRHAQVLGSPDSVTADL